MRMRMQMQKHALSRTHIPNTHAIHTRYAYTPHMCVRSQNPPVSDTPVMDVGSVVTIGGRDGIGAYVGSGFGPMVRAGTRPGTLVLVSVAGWSQ